MEYQEFKGQDVISVYLAMAIVSFALVFFVKISAQSFGGSEAHREMVQISKQIVSDGLTGLDASETEELGRTPASIRLGEEGRIGRDPWGTPYGFKVFYNESGHRVVAIWSSGPNGERETKEVDLLLSQNGRPLRILPRGDDLGHIEFGY